MGEHGKLACTFMADFIFPFFSDRRFPLELAYATTVWSKDSDRAALIKAAWWRCIVLTVRPQGSLSHLSAMGWIPPDRH